LIGYQTLRLYVISSLVGLYLADIIFLRCVLHEIHKIRV